MCDFLERCEKIIKSGDKKEEKLLLKEIEENIFLLLVAVCTDKNVCLDIVDGTWEHYEKYLKRRYRYRNGFSGETMSFIVTILEEICSKNKKKYVKDYLKEMTTKEFLAHFSNEVFDFIKNHILNNIEFPEDQTYGVYFLDGTLWGTYFVFPFTDKCFSSFCNERARKFREQNEEYKSYSFSRIRDIAHYRINMLEKLLFGK